MIDALLDLHILELQTYRDFQMLQLTPRYAEVTLRESTGALAAEKSEERKTVFIPKPKPTEEDVEEALFQRLSAPGQAGGERTHASVYCLFQCSPTGYVPEKAQQSGSVSAGFRRWNYQIAEIREGVYQRNCSVYSRK